MWKLPLILVILVAGVEVSASELDNCHQISDSLKRLACYDQTSGFTAVTPKNQDNTANAGTPSSATATALSTSVETKNPGTLIDFLLKPNAELANDETTLAAAEAFLLAYVKPLPASNAEANMRGYQALSKVRPDNKIYEGKAQKYKQAHDRNKYAILEKLKKEHVEFNNIIWYEHPSQPRYTDTRIFLQIYLGEKGKQVLTRVKLNYTADSWLFIENARANIDGETVSLPFSGWERDNDSEIWEWSDVILTPDLKKILLKIADSKKTIIRFNGQKYYDDWDVPSKDKKAIHEMLLAEKVLKQKVANK